jgi:hypothetical protein
MIKGKIRLRKSSDNKIFVEKTMKQVDQDVVDDLVKKRNMVRENRKEKRHKS